MLSAIFYAKDHSYFPIKCRNSKHLSNTIADYRWGVHFTLFRIYQISTTLLPTNIP